MVENSTDNAEWIEGRIKTFARQIESFLNTNPQTNDQNENEMRTKSLISCQVVSFGTEAGVVNTYSVFTCCHELSEYEKRLQDYFYDKKNLSIISIFKEDADDGIWVEYLSPEPKATIPESFGLTYAHRKTTANYKKFNTESDCRVEWLKWSKVMGEIYPFSRSVFSKNQRILLHKKEDGGIFSGVYLTFAVRLNYKQIGIIGQISDSLLQEIAYKQLIPDLYHNLETQATRAAISQVMARNMSHNIGSHVLSKFKDRKQFIDGKRFIGDDGTGSAAGRYASPSDDDSSVGAGAGNQYLGVYTSGLSKEGFTYDHGGLYANESQNYWVGENSELENYNQLAYFNEYLKNRMDLLADIATANPVMENAKYLYQEVFKGFDQNRILLNRISGISDEKFRYSVDLKLDTAAGVVALNKSNDIQVAMTNDILGAQGLYIILENIIRNIAKHAKPQDDERSNIVITIEVGEYEADPEYYEIQVYDNLRRDAASVEGKVKSRNLAFNDSILDKKDSTLRSKDLGTIEMDVCAAYMRRIPIEEVESDEYKLRFKGMNFDSDADKRRLEELDANAEKGCVRYEGEVLNEKSNPSKSETPSTPTKYPKLMFAFRKEHSEGRVTNPAEKYSLGYKFYLRKPKEVLIVVNANGSDAAKLPFELTHPSTAKALTDADGLAPFGIGLITKEALVDSLAKKTVYNHQLIYNATGSKLGTTIELAGSRVNVSSCLPKRIVEAFSETPKSLSPVQFVNQVWEKWAAVDVLKRFPNPPMMLVSLDRGQQIKAFTTGHDSIESEDIRSETSNFFIYRDNHAELWCECVATSSRGLKCTFQDSKLCEVKRKEAYRTKQPWTFNYYDMACSHSWITKHVDKLISEANGKRHLAEYLEIVSTKIVIIDERIQENMANPITPRFYGDKVDLFTYFRRQKIVIPRIPAPKNLNGEEFTDEAKKLLGLNNGDYVNLNLSDFQTCVDTKDGEIKGTVKDRLKAFVELHSDADFVVIHLGILEKLVPSETVKNKEGIKMELDELFGATKDILSGVVITSGRGEPDNVPEGIAYIPIAPIQNAVETVFDKAVLVKLLFNAREI